MSTNLRIPLHPNEYRIAISWKQSAVPCRQEIRWTNTWILKFKSVPALPDRAPAPEHPDSLADSVDPESVAEMVPMEYATGTEIRKSFHYACQALMPERAEGKPPVIYLLDRAFSEWAGSSPSWPRFRHPADSPMKTKAGPFGPASSKYYVVLVISGVMCCYRRSVGMEFQRDSCPHSPLLHRY